jgi:hypothetical protein
MSCIQWLYHLLSLCGFVCLVRPVNWHTGQQIVVSDTIRQILSGVKEPWSHTCADLYSKLAHVHLLHGRGVTSVCTFSGKAMLLYIHTHEWRTLYCPSLWHIVGHLWCYCFSVCCVSLWILTLFYWCANMCACLFDVQDKWLGCIAYTC